MAGSRTTSGVIGALALAALAACDRAPEAAMPGGEGRTASVPDGQTLILDTGAEIRLAAIRAPRPAEGRAPAEPGYHAARAGLAEAAMARIPELEPPAGPGGRDRFGRIVAQVRLSELSGERWVQARLVADGLVRVDPEAAAPPGDAQADASAREAVLALLALESAARAADRGVWAEPYYAVRAAEAAETSIGAFQIVEGRIVDAAEIRGVVYLNFGADWRTDFTAMIAREHGGRFDIDGLLASPGARVRVRGFVQSRNGPLIALTRAEQIEWLDGPEAGASSGGGEEP